MKIQVSGTILYKTNMADKIIVLFVEGYSEEKFYSLLCQQIQQEKGTRNKIIIKNLKGIGNYENKAHAKLKHEVLNRFDPSDVVVFLCYDTDVFDIPFQQKPPVNWKIVEKKIKGLQVTRVFHIKASKSIEDWFLLDINSLCGFLKIKTPRKSTKTQSGFEVMCKLFKQSNKVYQKGYNVNNFVEKLDFDLILQGLRKEISDLRSNM